jgi:hypothetical protein|tara:strand:- start:734 stop:1132 length:399 start_codon:yes stop_codon:yes gene_type:complete
MATFVRGSEEEVEMVVQNIVNSVLLTNKYIFVMSDEEDPENRIITYNADGHNSDIREVTGGHFTLRLHRKKKTNTLYTINGLNLAIQKEHGRTGRDLQLDWEGYRNCILLSKNATLKVIQAKLEQIMEVENL